VSVLYIEEYSSKISFVFRFAVCATTQNVAALELGLPFRQRAYRGCAPLASEGARAVRSAQVCVNVRVCESLKKCGLTVAPQSPKNLYREPSCHH